MIKTAIDRRQKSEVGGQKMKKKQNIRHFRSLVVYQRAFGAAMKIFEISKGFSSDEKLWPRMNAEKFCY